MPNYTPATAIEITALPYTLSVDLSASPDDSTNVPEHVEHFPVTNSGWWKIVADGSFIALSQAATGGGTDTIPTVALWIADPDNPGQYTQAISVDGVPLNQLTVRNVLPNPYTSDSIGYWLMFPVTTGVTYYLQVLNDSDPHVGPTADFTLTVRRPPRLTVPAGSLLITDDTTPYPSVAMSATGEVLRLFRTPVATELGDTLTTGEICTGSISATVYTNQLALVATTALSDPLAVVRAHPSGKWYLALQTGGATVKTINTAGTLGPDSWVLSASGNFQDLAVSPDETIAYWVGEPTGPTDISKIQRYDLVNDVPLSDLVVDSLVGFGSAQDMACLPDGSVLVLASAIADGAYELRRYSAAGALLHTYAIQVADYRFDHFKIETTGTFFWVWLQSEATDPRVGLWKRVKISDGSESTPFTFTLFNESGLGPVEANPFAPSNSCPLLFLATAILLITTTTLTANCEDNNLVVTGENLDSYTTIVVTDPANDEIAFSVVSATSTELILHIEVPITTGQYCVAIDDNDPICSTLSCQGETFPICRKCRFPLPFNMNMLTFLYRLEFLIQSGMSPNASITVNLSRDGGYTWPITRTLTAGAIAAYDWRVYTTNMGQGRNWVVEFVTEAPYFWALIQCYADMEAGTS